MVSVLWLLACGGKTTEDSATASVDPQSWSVLADGPLRVGFRTVAQTYTDPAGEPTTVTINLWYPTEDTAGEAPLYFGIQEDPGAFLDATLAPPQHAEGYPVMVFSHGSYLYGGCSGYLMRRFASHGWVVAAPDHIGNTVADYGDNTLPVYYHRPLDDSAAIDAVAQDAARGGAAVTDAVVLVGYSFGGYDGWVTHGGTLSPEVFEAQCAADGFTAPCTAAQQEAMRTDLSEPRVVAIVPLAGAGRFEYFAEGGLEGLGPVLQVSGTEDHDDPQRMWDITDGTPMTWVSIAGGCHEMFSTGGCSTIDRQDGYDLISAYTFAFARQQRFGATAETRDLLDGSLLPWDIVTLQSR